MYTCVVQAAQSIPCAYDLRVSDNEQKMEGFNMHMLALFKFREDGQLVPDGGRCSAFLRLKGCDGLEGVGMACFNCKLWYWLDSPYRVRVENTLVARDVPCGEDG